MMMMMMMMLYYRRRSYINENRFFRFRFWFRFWFWFWFPTMMMWLGWDACVCGFNSTYICSIPRTDANIICRIPRFRPISRFPPITTSHHITSQASNERINYLHFANALRKGYVPLSEETLYNEEVVKWAYNVALTRFHEVWEPNRQKLIAPMADMVS